MREELAHETSMTNDEELIGHDCAVVDDVVCFAERVWHGMS
jgi:hypothetical protein